MLTITPSSRQGQVVGIIYSMKEKI